MRNKTNLTLLDRILTKDFSGLVNQVTNFRYQAKKLRFVASNNYFDVHESKAVSYGWWTYFSKVEGINVFNKHAYSPSTRRHQSRMRDLLRKLGIRIDVEVDTRNSLDGLNMENVYQLLWNEVVALQQELAECKKPKSAKKDNILFKIEDVRSQIEYLRKLGVK